MASGGGRRQPNIRRRGAGTPHNCGILNADLSTRDVAIQVGLPVSTVRGYFERNRLSAERDVLRLFREWLVTVQGQSIRQQDIPSRDGDTIAFFTVPGQPSPSLPEKYPGS